MSTARDYKLHFRYIRFRADEVYDLTGCGFPSHRWDGRAVLVSDPSSFADRLKELREAAGVSQYRLAQMSGVNKQTLSRLEKGDGDPTWATVRKLARALGVSVAAFDDEQPAQPVTSPAPSPRPMGKRK